MGPGAVRGSSRRSGGESAGPPWRRVAGEAVQVLGLTAVVGLVLGKLSPVLGVSVLQSLAFLDSTTAAAASVVALLSALVARMRVDRRLLHPGRAGPDGGRERRQLPRFLT